MAIVFEPFAKFCVVFWDPNQIRGVINSAKKDMHRYRTVIINVMLAKYAIFDGWCDLIAF